MPKVNDHLSAIVTELGRLASHGPAHPEGDDPFDALRIIAVDDFRSIRISGEIERLIRRVADDFLTADPSLKARFTQNEWRETVRHAFGPALAMIDLDDPMNHSVETVLTEVKEQLEKRMERQEPLELAFGCTLFASPVPSFAIGPVRFEPRGEWLERKRGEGAVSDLAACRVTRAWTGGADHEASRTDLDVMRIIGTIADSPWVCSVRTDGLEPEAARQRSLLVARMALAAIALLWKNASRALKGLNLLYDGPVHSQVSLTFNRYGMSWRTNLSRWPSGPWLEEGRWEGMFSDGAAHFRVVAEVLDSLADPLRDHQRPEILAKLAQSLQWFHEGCREDVALIGIVKFAAAMDTLACGDGSVGIRRLVTARLGVRDDERVLADGTTMEKAVEEIYGTGRSKAIHGKRPDFAQDWSNTRNIAEAFARLCLMSCIAWADANPRETDPRRFSSVP